MRCTSLAVFAAFSLFASASSAQEFNKEQQKVLDAINALQDAWKAGNKNEFYRHVHEDFTGWYEPDILPVDLKTDKMWADHLIATREVKILTINPLKVIIKGETAVAQYIVSGLTIAKKTGEEKQSEWKWTDVWIKEKGQWKLLATHGMKAGT